MQENNTNRKSNKSLITLLIIGILLVVIAIPLYPIFEKPLCEKKIALDHAFCQLEVASLSIILGLFGLVMAIISIVSLCKNKKSAQRAQEKLSAKLVLLTTVRWLIAIVIGVPSILGLSSILINHNYHVQSILLLIILICLSLILVFWPKIKKRLFKKK